MDANITWLLCATFVVSSLAMLLVQLVKVNVFKFVVLMGTFALAMAFAGNDLVNFIGVPLAGLDSYLDFTTNAQGVSADSYLMTSLMESAKTPPFYLLLAGVIMIIAMATSKLSDNRIDASGIEESPKRNHLGKGDEEEQCRATHWRSSRLRG